MCTFQNGLTQDENLHIYLLFLIYINSHNHVFKLLDHMLRFFFTREPDITRHYKKFHFVHSQMYCKKILWYICFTIIYKNQTKMFQDHLQLLFQACCKISILIVKSYTKCTQNISSKVPSIKIFCNNKSLYLFLTYWISVMVNLK